MKSLLIVISLLACVSCTTPGQHYQLKDWVIESADAETQTMAQVTPLSASVIASLKQPAVSAVSANPELEKQLREYEYRVGPRDVLIFTIWDHPELTIPAGEFRSPEIQGHLVSVSGEVFFPYVGTMKVAGWTLEKIRIELTRRLGQYIKNPQLDVRIAAFRSKRVNVSGQVARPGFFPITDTPITLVEAINLAGGVASTGTMQQVQLIRAGQSLRFDLTRLLQHGDLRQNTILQDGDIVYVPANNHFAAHVLGGVEQPGLIPIVDGQLNLAEAITGSGGFNNDRADPSRVFVFRNDSDAPIVYWLDAQSADAMLLATQFQLQPQDVIFVGSTGLARWNAVINQLLPTIQTLWQTQSLIDRFGE